MDRPETKSLTVSPGPRRRTVRTEDGVVIDVPDGWALLPPGDAGLTRRVKAAGPAWTVKEKKGRRLFSRGVWAPSQRIERLQGALAAERLTPAYRQKQASAKARRDRTQQDYVREFTRHVEAFLAFHDAHRELGRQLAVAIAEHATPVGSGTVARTQRIPVAERAEAATIAWMRHQTTAYDRMNIPRVKGRRREVRRALAKRSRELLSRYRRAPGSDSTSVADAPSECVLKAALKSTDRPQSARPLPSRPRRSSGPPSRSRRPAATSDAPASTGTASASSSRPSAEKSEAFHAEKGASAPASPPKPPLGPPPIDSVGPIDVTPDHGAGDPEQDARAERQAKVRERLRRRRWGR